MASKPSAVPLVEVIVTVIVPSPFSVQSGTTTELGSLSQAIRGAPLDTGKVMVKFDCGTKAPKASKVRFTKKNTLLFEGP